MTKKDQDREKETLNDAKKKNTRDSDFLSLFHLTNWLQTSPLEKVGGGGVAQTLVCR